MKKIISILILAAFISPVCFAKGGGNKNLHKKMFEKLDLTEDQKAKLTDIRKNSKVDVKKLRTKKKELKKAMKQAMTDDTSESKLRGLHNDISSIQKEIKSTRFEKMLKIRKILSPEQRKSFFEMKNKMGKHRNKNKHSDD